LALLLCSKHGSKRDFQQSVFSKKHFHHQNALSKIHFLAVLSEIALPTVQFFEIFALFLVQCCIFAAEIKILEL